ncbi:peptidoglycan DD-metalloendopeptidase family protein [Chitinophaga sp. CC14]|uniref:peptidoglycan DD-metalloendopeptidase family protein n=1 Tax=Chitinophaga sp. CC14 TaxID=3029199 RepID=UPI003B79D2FA
MNLKSILTILLFLTFTTAFSQTESAENSYTSAKFEKYYNDGQFDSIYAIFSPQAQIALPLDKTVAFLTKLKSNYGNITKRAFLEYKSAFAVYKTTFEKGVLSLSISANKDSAITGLYAKPYEPDTLPVMQRNITAMRLPFKGEWTVFWGGDTKELNYHVVVKFQKNAFDIVINNPEGRSFRTSGKTNEDYYAFGQPIIAPCDGEVVWAVDGVKDNVPGELNPMYVPGNAVLLKTQNKEYVFFAHFKQNSIKVKQGDQIKQGQLIGLCGNSGNSSEPHLHFHLQNVENLNQATGVKCYFEKLEVNGLLKTDYSPIKGDKIREVR